MKIRQVEAELSREYGRIDGQTGRPTDRHDEHNSLIFFGNFAILRTVLKLLCAITMTHRKIATTFCYANWIRMPAHLNQFYNFVYLIHSIRSE
jgi:hypothetical protein